jgi:hypothetical protein
MVCKHKDLSTYPSPIKKKSYSRALVAYAQENSSVRPYLEKKPFTKKGWWSGSSPSTAIIIIIIIIIIIS